MNNWKKQVRTVIPYVPGEQPSGPDIIKLNTNENPYPPSPGAVRALAGLPDEAMRLYPDPASTGLVSALADCCGVSPEQVFVGVGSDDVLSMSFLTFFNGTKPILFPDITYSFYDVWANLYRIPFRVRPLDGAFHIRAEDYRLENGGIIFPNPNAPTGICEPLEIVEEIVAGNPDSVVIVDEAYIDFASRPSALSLLPKYDNLLVVQTFSKSRSMAGMRIGYCIGSRDMIKALNDVKYSFNSYTMNRAALVMGEAAVKDTGYFRECVERIIQTREETKAALAGLGFTFPPSEANFIFASHKTVPARHIFEELRRKKIFVRYFEKCRIDNYLRITIGTPEQMDALVRALEGILSEAGWEQESQ